MKHDRLLTKLLRPLGGVIGLLCMAVLLAGCTPPKAATATPTRTPTLTLTPTQTPTPTVTFTPSPTPDPEQQPPGYRLVTPEFSYQFLDPPASHSGQQAIVYWDEGESPNVAYFKYLTLEGGYGELMRVEFPPETQGYRVASMSGEDVDAPVVFYSQDYKRHSGDEAVYIFNLWDRSVLGFAYDGKAAACSSHAEGEEYIVLGCTVYDGDESYYYFIPRSNPERVTRGEEGNPDYSLYWQGDRLIRRDRYGPVYWYCIFDILPGQPICKLFEEYWVGVLPSPDDKWLEIRQGRNPSQTDKVGLIPFSCVEDPATECEPQWLPIHHISSNWVWDCKALDLGLWTPNSQQLLFLVDHPSGTAGPDPNANCKGVWTGQELWRYDLPSGTLEMVRKYEVGSGYYWPWWLRDTLFWASDGTRFVAITSRNLAPEPYLDDWIYQVYLVSSEDGEMTLIDEIPDLPLGVIQIP